MRELRPMCGSNSDSVGGHSPASMWQQQERHACRPPRAVAPRLPAKIPVPPRSRSQTNPQFKSIQNAPPAQVRKQCILAPSRLGKMRSAAPARSNNGINRGYARTPQNQQGQDDNDCGACVDSILVTPECRRTGATGRATLPSSSSMSDCPCQGMHQQLQH